MRGRIAGLPALVGKSAGQAGASGRHYGSEGGRYWDASHPIAYWTASSGTAVRDRAPLKSNKWLLHPWLPVDVRLPAFIGVAGTACYIYLQQTGQLTEAQEYTKKQWAHVKDHVDMDAIKGGLGKAASTVKDLGDAAWAKASQLIHGTATGADRDVLVRELENDMPHSPDLNAVPGSLQEDALAPALSKESEPTPDTTSTSASDSATAPPSSIAAGGREAGAEDTAAEEPVVVDMHAINTLFAEALGVAPASEHAPGTVTEPGAGPAPGDATATARHRGSAAGAEADGASRAPAGGPDRGVDLAHAKQGITGERGGLGASSGSQVVLQDSRQPVEAGVRSRLEAGPTDELVLHTAGLLGLSHDVSSSGLVAAAAGMGLGPVAGTTPYDAAYRQALADTESFKGVLKQVAKHYEDTVEGERSATRRWEAQALEYLAIAEGVVEKAAAQLEAQAEAHEAAQDAALRQQELELAVQYERDANRERVERIGAIDAVRGDVNALKLALDHRDAELAQSSSAHRVSAALFSLCNALANGGPITAETAALRATAAAGDDALVLAVLTSLPDAAVRGTLDSVAELQARWVRVRRAVRVHAAMAKDSQPGVLSTGLAYVASALKVSERAGVALGHRSASVESQLALIDDAVERGQLRTATALLEELAGHVAVGPVAEGYTAAVRTRAVAEQAATLLRSHAAALAGTAS